MSGNLRIEYLPLSALRPYERNARTHSPEQVADGRTFDDIVAERLELAAA